jgi:hypothetical protein
MPRRRFLPSSAITGLAILARLMVPLPWRVLVTVLTAAAVFALILDQIKLIVISVVKVE